MYKGYSGSFQAWSARAGGTAAGENLRLRGGPSLTYVASGLHAGTTAAPGALILVKEITHGPGLRLAIREA